MTASTPIVVVRGICRDYSPVRARAPLASLSALVHMTTCSLKFRRVQALDHVRLDSPIRPSHRITIHDAG